ncbi:DUF4244 domain-containing protein [Leucobacter sp. CSA2]|uniref:DUF4244 domain-containing protein n=2 Tax=Leucobacter edaphi TaxID=2796472 RepID=A0A934QD94_9MICO|nr:DUF4244 domain-containing protein [Leucobacter edaphi]
MAPQQLLARRLHPAGKGLCPVIDLRTREHINEVEPPHPRPGRIASLLSRFRKDERGAVTAEYAIVIMAGVAFAGLLVAILRSDEIRAMLVTLVQNALGTTG